MSKILCTLAFYHDGGTRRPQLVISSNPGTNLVMKGSDWRGARFSNGNATAGARHRFEYSFTGGKSVTRCSLVINTSAILPPFIWLSKHPTGAPTKTGPRGKPGTKATEQAKLAQQREALHLEAKKSSSSSKKRIAPRDERAKMMAEHGVYVDSPLNSRGESSSRSPPPAYKREGERRLKLRDRNREREEKSEQRIISPREEFRDGERFTRRVQSEREIEEHRESKRGNARDRDQEKEWEPTPPPYTPLLVPSREARRMERLKRLRSESTASESSDGARGDPARGAGADRYRRSRRRNGAWGGEERGGERDLYRSRRLEGYAGAYSYGGGKGDGDGEGDGDGGDGGGGD